MRAGCSLAFRLPCGKSTPPPTPPFLLHSPSDYASDFVDRSARNGGLQDEEHSSARLSELSDSAREWSRSSDRWGRAFVLRSNTDRLTFRVASAARCRVSARSACSTWRPCGSWALLRALAMVSTLPRSTEKEVTEGGPTRGPVRVPFRPSRRARRPAGSRHVLRWLDPRFDHPRRAASWRATAVAVTASWLEPH